MPQARFSHGAQTLLRGQAFFDTRQFPRLGIQPQLRFLCQEAIALLSLGVERSQFGFGAAARHRRQRCALFLLGAHASLDQRRLLGPEPLHRGYGIAALGRDARLGHAPQLFFGAGARTLDVRQCLLRRGAALRLESEARLGDSTHLRLAQPIGFGGQACFGLRVRQRRMRQVFRVHLFHLREARMLLVLLPLGIFAGLRGFGELLLGRACRRLFGSQARLCFLENLRFGFRAGQRRFVGRLLGTRALLGHHPDLLVSSHAAGCRGRGSRFRARPRLGHVAGQRFGTQARLGGGPGMMLGLAALDGRADRLHLRTGRLSGEFVRWLNGLGKFSIEREE